ncbi:hypothetical protein V6N13_039439 [Hibiscus sabdariffa]
MLSSFTTIKTLMNTSYNDLADVLLCLLRNPETRDSVLDILQKSSIKTHQRPIYRWILYLVLVLASYVFNSIRLDLRGLTALHATSEEVAEWIDKVNPVKTDGSGW